MLVSSFPIREKEKSNGMVLMRRHRAIAPYLPRVVKSGLRVGVRARAAKLTAMPCAYRSARCAGWAHPHPETPFPCRSLVRPGKSGPRTAKLTAVLQAHSSTASASRVDLFLAPPRP